MESVATVVHREPWNEGKVVGQKAPFKLKDTPGPAWDVRKGPADLSPRNSA
nr:hypothetical protein [Ideonella sp. A 288]